MSQYLHEQITKRDCPDCGGSGYKFPCKAHKKDCSKHVIPNCNDCTDPCPTCSCTGSISDCWHEWERVKGSRDSFEREYKCKCGLTDTRRWAENWISQYPANLTYTDEKGFYIALQWAMDQEWFVDFICPITVGPDDVSRVINRITKILDDPFIPISYLNKETFAPLLESYLKERDATK